MATTLTIKGALSYANTYTQYVYNSMGVPVPPASSADYAATPARRRARRGFSVLQHTHRQGTVGLCGGSVPRALHA